MKVVIFYLGYDHDEYAVLPVLVNNERCAKSHTPAKQSTAIAEWRTAGETGHDIRFSLQYIYKDIADGAACRVLHTSYRVA